jgi:hypothetical protein
VASNNQGSGYDFLNHVSPVSRSCCRHLALTFSPDGAVYVGPAASDRTGTLTALRPFNHAREFYDAWREEHLKLIMDRQLFIQFPVNAYLVFCFLRKQAQAVHLHDFEGAFERGPFFWKHTDDKGDHILMDHNFHITGIIDWTFARVVPTYEGFGPYSPWRI